MRKIGKEIETVSLIGVGFVAGLIASRVGHYNFSLRLYDKDPKIQLKNKMVVNRIKRDKKKHGVSGNVTIHDTLAEAVADADLVLESVPEKIDIKKRVFAEIDKLAPSHAIIATNSSSIPVSQIEDVVKRKDKVLNIHFYPPIIKTPMADIMRGTQTSDDTFEKGKKWIEAIHCTPLVVKKECKGFVFNRVWHAIKKECLKIWAGGYADIETVDTAWKIWTGMRIGLFKMMDGVGLDVVYDIEMSYFNESGDLNDKPPDELLEKIKKGELGNKAGKGFYIYK